jgi:hypothetical protein
MQEPSTLMDSKKTAPVELDSRAKTALRALADAENKIS